MPPSGIVKSSFLSTSEIPCTEQIFGKENISEKWNTCQREKNHTLTLY